MQTLTKTKSVSITGTKLAIATLAALAAAGAAFMLAPPRSKVVLSSRAVYKVGCAIEGHYVTSTTNPPVYLPYYEYNGPTQMYRFVKSYQNKTVRDINGARELCKQSQKALLQQYCSLKNPPPAYGVALLYGNSTTSTTSTPPLLFDYQCVDSGCLSLYCQ